MKKNIGILVGAFLICSYLLFGLQQRGTGMLRTLKLAVGIWVGFPTFGCVIYRFAKYRRLGRERDLRELWSAATVLVVVLCIVATNPIGKRLLARDIEEAKSYCEELVSSGVLDGRPEDLKGLIDEGDLPRLLKGRKFYWRHSQGGYELSFSYSFDFAWTWDSRTGEWHLST